MAWRTLPLPWATQHEPRPMRISPTGPADGRRRGGLGGLAVLLLVQEVGQDLGDHLRRQPAVGHVVDLEHGGQRAAAEAGDLLHGEQPVAVRVLPVGRPRRRSRASCTSGEPLTWQAVPWQTLTTWRPTGRWRNWV